VIAEAAQPARSYKIPPRATPFDLSFFSSSLLPGSGTGEHEDLLPAWASCIAQRGEALVLVGFGRLGISIFDCKPKPISFHHSIDFSRCMEKSQTGD
jgi:hypothetical protein